MNKHTNKLQYRTLTIISALFLLSTIILSSCEDEEVDTVPPQAVSNVSAIPTNGGAIITYDQPEEEDLMYVRAEYTNTLGESVFKASSIYSNSIEVDGFNEETEQTVTLYAVDRNGNMSEGVNVNFTPLKSFIYLVQESITLKPALGGVQVEWTNEAKKTVFVYLNYNNNEEEGERILSSSSAAESLVVRGLDSTAYSFSTKIEDFSGNTTTTQELGIVKPLFEEKINKSSWTLVQSLSVDGNAWEGETVNFWDDVVDTKDSPDDNSYFIINRDDNGGTLTYPLDIVIDFNKDIVLNRFTVWQRAYTFVDGNNGVSVEYYYYQNENMRSFDLFASNDLENWQIIGSYDIGDPKDEDGNVPPDKIQEAIDGHEFEMPEATEPFRYMKFSITSSFGSETNVYGSEITIYGLDNVE